MNKKNVWEVIALLNRFELPAGSPEWDFNYMWDTREGTPGKGDIRAIVAWNLLNVRDVNADLTPMVAAYMGITWGELLALVNPFDLRDDAGYSIDLDFDAVTRYDVARILYNYVLDDGKKPFSWKSFLDYKPEARTYA